MFGFLLFVGIVILMVYWMNKFSGLQRKLEDIEKNQKDLGQNLSNRIDFIMRSQKPGPTGETQWLPSIEKRLAQLSGHVDSLINYLIKRYNIKDVRQKADEKPVVPEKPSVTPLVTQPASTPEAVSKIEYPQADVPAVQTQAPERTHAAQPEKSWLDAIDWEKFTGIKLFSWIGGLALFLGSLFFVKYSIDQGWISPLVRVSVGFLAGIGAVVGGLRLQKNGYSVTVQTLCAAGIAVLYADIFAASSYYHFIPSGLAFLLMIMVTVTAFLLAVRLDSIYVAFLGLIGGFLTPPLLSTGVDRPFALFLYIALLDIGTMAIALRKKWTFLIPFAAAGTVMMQIGWALKFFVVSKALTACAIFLVFPVLFLAIHLVAVKQEKQDDHTFNPAFALPLISMLFAGYMMSLRGLSSQPGLVLSFLFLLDALIMFGAVKFDRARIFHFIAGVLSFLILMVWSGSAMTSSNLYTGLAFFLIFAVLHAAFPIVLQRLRPSSSPVLWANIYPLLMMIPMMIPILRETTSSYFIWVFVFILNAVLVVGAFLAGAVAVMFGALGLTLLAVCFWLFHLPSAAGVPGFLIILGFFSLCFFAVGAFMKKWQNKSSVSSQDKEESGETTPFWRIDPARIFSLQAISGLLPFLLLIMAAGHLSLPNPGAVFGLGLVFIVLLLGLVRYQKADEVGLVALAGAFFLQLAWHGKAYAGDSFLVASPWYHIYFIGFCAFPFVFQQHMKDRLLPWIMSAFSGPLFFYLIYKAMTISVGQSMIGFLPMGFAVIYLVGLKEVSKWASLQNPLGKTQLALFGGMALFFISLIFPLQFDKEWITVAWALEGMALIWLFHRIPHNGLKYWGAGLLGISFVRLALNPAVLEYHARTSMPLLNWYVYAYGLSVVCLLVSACLWKKTQDTSFEKSAPGMMNVMAGILAFLLMNIEIADFFSSGSTLTFQFSGNLAQDMSYSIGWGLFAFALLIIGIRAQNKPARLASLALLVVTMGKVFFHDLWRLGQLYRVGSFIGLAGVLILVSFLYQKYIAKD